MLKTKALRSIVALAVTCACSLKDDDPDPVEQAPDPIGPELMRFEAVRSTCPGGSHFYRQGRAIQSFCFELDGTFKYENRGTLTPEAAAMLDAEIAAADPNDTEPVNHNGFCGAPDSIGVTTLWVGEVSVAFELSCLIKGLVPLYEYVSTIWNELDQCEQGLPVWLESIEPGCRWM